MDGSDAQPGFAAYERGTDEFSRVLAFSDAVFAIAMTLLVVGIAVPTFADHGDELADALNDLLPSFVSFFISFAVIGRYWAAHHQFCAGLARVDRGLVAINLVYLAVIFFLASVPVAFVSTTLAVVVWFGGIPFQLATRGRKPAEADRFY